MDKSEAFYQFVLEDYGGEIANEVRGNLNPRESDFYGHAMRTLRQVLSHHLMRPYVGPTVSSGDINRVI